MTDRHDYMRSRAKRGRGGRGQQETDAIVVALTLQIIVCLLILIAANIAKRANEQKYSAVKQEYVGLTSGGDVLLSGLGDVGEFGENLFETVERVIGNTFGGAEPAGETSPGIEVDAGEGQEGFGYQYLAEGDVMYTSEDLTGMGGYNPVAQLATSTDGAVEVPDNSTLAPVYLSVAARPPINGPITSEFAYRVHPITETNDFHNGIDIAAEEGRGILAALPGTVVEVGVSDIYGLYIILEHADNLQTFYAHCSEIIAEEGMVIRQGERIAKVGATGMVTGPHLHFSVIVDELYTDPTWILQDYLRVVE